MDKYTKKQQMISGEQEDTANLEFSRILDKKKKTIKELTIPTPLYGHLNLSILAEKGFLNIESLRFVEGYIISLTNIPVTITKLIVSNQLLDKIELPDDLEYLEIENNLFVGEFSLKSQHRLKYINVSFNQIKSFGKNGLDILPESLEELYCHHNLLQNLYLGTCPKLRVLYCDYNPKLKVYDIPDTVVDIRLPEKAVQLEEDKKVEKEKAKEKNSEENVYMENLEKYFFIKQKYENELHSLQKKQRKQKKTLSLPKCYGCKRKVGMVFSGKNQKYTAYCGDTTTKPCDWKMILHRGDNYGFRDTMEEMRKTLEETKENIIRQKMDTLFDYITEEKSVDLFKKQLSLFKINSEMVNNYQKRYEDMYFNSVKKEIIQQKKRKIQEKILEIQEKIESGEIEEVVKLQMEIKGISDYIQRETYEFMEMVFYPKKEEFVLDQQKVVYSKLEINHGE